MNDNPPWLADAAAALGYIDADGKPLALNWTQVLQEIRKLRARLREHEKPICEACHDLHETRDPTCCYHDSWPP